MSALVPPGTAGRRIIEASWAGTLLFAATAIPAALGLDIGYLAVVVSLTLFGVSIPLSLYALAKAAVRIAREEDRITVTGLFWLKGSAPKPVRRLLLGSVWASVGILVFTAPSEPFGVLVPVYPMALGALWGAKHGTFFKLPEPPAPRPRKMPEAAPAPDPGAGPDRPSG